MTAVGLVYLLLIAAAYALCFRRDRARTAQSLRVAGASLLKLLPLLAAIFALIGLFQVFIPPEIIERQLGAVSIGPPLAAYPLAGSLLEAGAWPPAVAAFIVSWVSVGVVTLPFEAEVFGARFALTRNVLSFAAALLIGLLVGTLS